MPDPVTLYCYVDFTEPIINSSLKRPQDEETKYYWKAKTHNFNDSSETLSNQEA
jgi:hypothetical protein